MKLLVRIKIYIIFALALRKKCERSLKNCENSSAGRARPCQGRGRGFEPRFSLKIIKYQLLCLHNKMLEYNFN